MSHKIDSLAQHLDTQTIQNRIVYEDNHILIYNKACGDLVQGDATGDASLLDILRAYIKIRDHKPGNVFLDAVHRIDRPVSGVVLFAKTSKALSRTTTLFRERQVERVYWAITEGIPTEPQGQLTGYLHRNPKQNKSYVVPRTKLDAKHASLHYKVVGHTDNYYLIKVALDTGRHHQARALLAHAGAIVRGDLKYGAKRSLPGGGISLHARHLRFEHPVQKRTLYVEAPPPADPLWALFPPEDNS